MHKTEREEIIAERDKLMVKFLELTKKLELLKLVESSNDSMVCELTLDELKAKAKDS